MTAASPLHRVVLIAWLTVVWVTLWGSVTLANVGGGLLVAIAIVSVFPPSPVRPDRPGESAEAVGGTSGGSEGVLAGSERLRVRPLRLVGLIGWFAWALVVSTWQVAVAAITPPRWSKVRTEVVEVPLRSSSPVVTALVANAITLTPGTLTLEAGGVPSTLSVHGMFVDDATSVRDDVWDIERRVVAAVGTRQDRAAVDGAASDGAASDGAASDGDAGGDDA